MHTPHDGTMPINLQDAPVDVQEIVTHLVAKLIRAKKLSKNYECAQIRSGIEDLICRENLDSTSVYDVFGSLSSDEAIDAAEKYLQ
jgi:hypothetical protein